MDEITFEDSIEEERLKQILLVLYYFEEQWNISDPILLWISEQLDEKYRSEAFNKPSFYEDPFISIYSELDKLMRNYKCILSAENQNLVVFDFYGSPVDYKKMFVPGINDSSFYRNARNQLIALSRYYKKYNLWDIRRKNWKRYLSPHYFKDEYCKLFFDLDHGDYFFENNVYISLTPKGREYITPYIGTWKPREHVPFRPNVATDAYKYIAHSNLENLGDELIQELIDNVILECFKQEYKSIELISISQKFSINFKQAEELAFVLSSRLSLIDFPDYGGFFKMDSNRRFFSIPLHDYPSLDLNERGEQYALHYAKNPRSEKHTIHNYGGQVNVSKNNSTLHAQLTIHTNKQITQILDLMLPYIRTCNGMDLTFKNELISILERIQIQSEGQLEHHFREHAIERIKECQVILQSNSLIFDLLSNLIEALTPKPIP
ncbi:hypothetical protein [Shimazuella kribbensis]|uniref:hypothetical protein n=1 Tax=Shimazuella kribbensis TaxID=139808 RepID=UPI00041F5482|nr:hypothetical protein [Shimazuella kribbensis]